LREHLREKEDDWTCKILMATDIATGLEYIHAANIVHCNPNSKNILMHHPNDKLMIIDFMSLGSRTELTLKITEENIAYVDPKFFNPTNTKKLKTFLALENREDHIHLTPVDCKELYCDSWNSDPEKRPSINEVINRLKDIEFECVYQDSNYIPEIYLGSLLRNRIRFTSKNSASLEVVKGSALNRYIFLPPGEISIGRGNSNDIIIKDQEITKRHARIIINYQGQVEIKELGSDYGIFVNGEKLGFRASRLLIRDDVISMGHSEFQYLPTGEYKSRMDEPFINDQNDHMAGDYTLKELTNLIQNNYVRSEDIFARYGGDEFILLKDTNKTMAFETAEKIRVETCNALLLHADNASKKAKECGRDQVIIWSIEPNSTFENENCLSESPIKSTEDGNNHSKSLSASSSTMDDEIGITIIKSDKREECYMYLPRKETLSFVRTKLEEYDDFHMGTNYHFTTKNGIPILRKDESKLNNLQIIETRDDDTHFLYIKEGAEFDLLQLRNEKGFKFGFVREEKEYKCNYVPNANCKRNLIIDEKFSAALEWFCNSLKLFRKSSEHATNEFIKDVKAALNNNKDIIKQFRDVSEKYGHFYAHHLVLGVARVKNKSHIINSGAYGLKLSSMFRFGFEVLKALGHRILKAGTEDIPFKLKNSTNSISSSYIHNLSPHIREIGDVNNYQVFASIMSKSNKNLFSAHIDYVNKDKNTPVIVVHNIKRENSSSTICLVKLGWIIVGPLANFDFNVQFPLVFKSMKQSVRHMASTKENHSTVEINNYKTCILGICASEADSQSSSTNNIDYTRKKIL
ncbi:15975_t:CDS:10, partial [Dentiscutata erythropus]